MKKPALLGIILLALSVVALAVGYERHHAYKKYWEGYVKRTLGDQYTVSNVVMPSSSAARTQAIAVSFSTCDA